MMVVVRQMLVKDNKYKYKCPNSMTPKYITIHNTANDASANNEVQYMINNTNLVSYHFAVDDKEVVQGLPIDRNAWHCGDGKGQGNMASIGVEICYSKSGGERYEKAEANAIKFVAQLLKERGWGIDRVKKHQDWSRKNCPHRILDEGRWQQVLNAIKAEMDASVASSSSQAVPSKGEALSMLMVDLVGEKKLNELGHIYQEARMEGLLSSTEWEIYCWNKSLTFGQAIYLETVLNHRRYKRINNQLPTK